MSGLDFWWELEFKDGEVVNVPPHHVPLVKKQIAEGRSIVTKNWTKPVNQYVRFEKTTKPFASKLLSESLAEEAARAFNEPVEGPNGGVLAAYVKKAVSRREWQGHYSKRHGYYLMSDSGSQVIMAYLRPVHNIKEDEVELTAEEVRKLNK